MAKNMVEIVGVTKRFGSSVAVHEVNLEIQAGEFLTLLGPSGCGKTTLLRMISGFETPSSGRILLDGQDVTHAPPYKRDVNQVFQSYALFPHLNVRDNIAFGLKMRRIAKAEMDARIADAVKMVSLEGLEARRPNQLSGGQRQRVALARAIVCRPKVLLLDEPLSALDAKLRHQMQVELKELQGELGITFIFVTHDQEEALTMSDRIAVVNKGRIEQLGTVDEIYYQPRTKFVANFIGQANIIEAEVASRQGRLATVRLQGGLELMISADNLAAESKSALVSVRPEKIHLERKPRTGENTFPAFVKDEFFKGATDQLVIETETGLKLTAIVANEGVWDETFHKGDRIHCQIHPTDIVVVEEWNE